jgi:hypothetical protein
MKQSDTEKYTLFLKKLSTEQIDKLLATLLRELRRRDSDHVSGDVVANTKALRRLRTSDL